METKALYPVKVKKDVLTESYKTVKFCIIDNNALFQVGDEITSMLVGYILAADNYSLKQTRNNKTVPLPDLQAGKPVKIPMADGEYFFEIDPKNQDDKVYNRIIIMTMDDINIISISDINIIPHT